VSILDQLNSGSFRGASFLVVSATTSGGRKQVLHEYVNSDKQSVEDLGFKPRNFKLTAIITGANANDPRSYFQKRDELLKALETAGNGTLSHPFFESSFEVTARPYTLDESMAALGKATITMEFDYNFAKTNPSLVTNSLSSISQRISGFVDSAKTSFVNTFNAISPLSYESAVGLFDTFTDTTQSIVNTFSQVQSAVSPFNNLITTFRSNITSLIPVPQNLADDFFEIMGNVEGLFDAPETLYDVYSRFFGFEDDAQFYQPTTVQRVETNTNTALIRNTVQSVNLAYAYQAACQIEYTTVDAIEQVQNQLNTEFTKLQGYDLDPSVLLELSNIRTSVIAFLEQEKLTAADVVTVETRRMPLQVLAYSYYAEKEQTDYDETFSTLIDLNRPKSNNLESMVGDVEVLTQ
jgi:prophage DNA circulation protein